MRYENKVIKRNLLRERKKDYILSNYFFKKLQNDEIFLNNKNKPKKKMLSILHKIINNKKLIKYKEITESKKNKKTIENSYNKKKFIKKKYDNYDLDNWKYFLNLAYPNRQFLNSSFYIEREHKFKNNRFIYNSEKFYINNKSRVGKHTNYSYLNFIKKINKGSISKMYNIENRLTVFKKDIFFNFFLKNIKNNLILKEIDRKKKGIVIRKPDS
jgi:hypothetical protein